MHTVAGGMDDGKIVTIVGNTLCIIEVVKDEVEIREAYGMRHGRGNATPGSSRPVSQRKTSGGSGGRRGLRMKRHRFAVADRPAKGALKET